MYLGWCLVKLLKLSFCCCCCRRRRCCRNHDAIVLSCMILIFLGACSQASDAKYAPLSNRRPPVSTFLTPTSTTIGGAWYINKKEKHTTRTVASTNKSAKHHHQLYQSYTNFLIFHRGRRSNPSNDRRFSRALNENSHNTYDYFTTSSKKHHFFRLKMAATSENESLNCEHDTGAPANHDQHEINKSNNNEEIQHYDLAIIGAGASGLMCAHHLMKHYNKTTTKRNARGDNGKQSSSSTSSSPPSMIILEARNRIGGRIDSETINVRNVTGETVQLVRDNGAAWVHGIGSDWIEEVQPPSSMAMTEDDNGDDINNRRQERTNTTYENELPEEDQSPSSSSSATEENPMMPLLEQVVPSPNEHVQSLLNPIFPQGNPWMRPQHVLYQGNNVAFYVAGTYLEYRKNNKHAIVIQKSLDRHYQIMKNVSKIGNDMFNSGDGIDTVNTSLQQTIDKLSLLHEKPNITNKNVRYDDNDSDDDKASLSDENNEEAMIEALTPFYRYLIENWNAASSSQLQLSEFIHDDDGNISDNDDDCVLFTDHDYCSEGDFYGPHCTVRNGMKTLLNPLLKDGVSECIRLNQEVRNLTLLQSKKNGNDDIGDDDDNNDSAVVLQCKAGLHISADVCVVTLPLGCLQESIRNNDKPFFQPPLSDEKQEAICAHRMGIYKKVFLTFDRVFWSTDESMIGMIRCVRDSRHSNDDHDNDTSMPTQNTLGNYLVFYNCWAKDGLPCIETVLCANKWAVNRSDKEIRDAVLDFMQDSMGQGFHIKEWFVDCHITRWEEDRFSGWGAYSSYGLGTLERHTDALKSPEWNSKLLFCGEATISEHEGSVHAALMSGVRAAREVIQMN